MVEWTMHGTSKKIEDVPEGATILVVNGKDVAGMCEGCGKPVYVGTAYTTWEDDILTHKKCRGKITDDVIYYTERE